MNETAEVPKELEGVGSDIPLELATAAHRGTSFSPEKRGQSHVVEYAQILLSDWEILAERAQTEEQLEVLKAEFAKYRAGYKARYLAWLHAKSRCISPMIAGPSKFPVRRQEKANITEHNRCTDLIDFRERMLNRIRKIFRDTSEDPIRSGDSDAIPRLQEKLDSLVREQERMKKINAAHKKFLMNPASLDTADLTEAEKNLVRSYKPAYSWEPHPYAPYQLSNNNKTITNTRQRLEQLKTVKALPVQEVEAGNGVRLEDNPEDSRVRIYFPGKPDADVRSRLKSNGFRWAPSLGCWQAYRNSRSLQFARQYLQDNKNES